jgi:hypothetical protein
MGNYVHVRVQMPSEAEKQAHVDKTARLRSLRLAKEAVDREQADREVALTSPSPTAS